MAKLLKQYHPDTGRRLRNPQRIPSSLLKSKLDKSVGRILNGMAKEAGAGGPASVIADLREHGCVSGMVGELTTYAQTSVFFAAHLEGINSLLVEALDYTTIADIT